MEQKGKLVVISGFSGAGKGTLMKALLAAHPDRYALSVSATTRDPRPGEKDGVDYFFVTDETFDSMIQKDDFLEYAKYVSHSYGTPRSYVEENLNLGKNVILEIEIQGALKVKEKIKDAVLMFVTAPDAGTLRQLLQLLGMESPRELMRQKEDLYKSLNLADPALSDAALIQAMVANPKLIERPIVVSRGQARIGRPPEQVLEIVS